MSQQILPPIERLCKPMEGTDRARLAECLGLVLGRYRSYVGGDSDNRAFSALESQKPDSVRFKDCDPLMFCCRMCTGEMPFTHISQRDVSTFSSPISLLLRSASNFNFSYRRPSCKRLGPSVPAVKHLYLQRVCKYSLRTRFGSVSASIMRAGLCATIRRVGTVHE